MALTLRANLQLLFPSDSPHRQSAAAAISYPNSLPRNSTGPAPPPASFSTALSWMTISEKKEKQSKKRGSSSTVVAAVGDVSPDGTAYLFVGAAAVALLGTAFPVFFSRKDLCPECDGAGFIRKPGAALRANAARKDQAQIVCARCNGLGKLNQVDK